MIKEGGVPKDAAFGTIDSWLLFKLTGRHATDYSNASRTLLFNIRELTWDPELCDTLGVPIESLPEPVRNAEVLGETDLFGGKVPVAAMVGDQQGALYGQACLDKGLGKNTYGTGNFLLQNAGSGAADPGAGADHDDRVGDRRPRRLRDGVVDVRHRRRASSGCATA